MKLTRVRIWGIKDGKRIYIDQQGPTLQLDPEVPSIRTAWDIEQAARQYLDEVVDCWNGKWSSDEELQESANSWNKYRKAQPRPRRKTVAQLRKKYEDLAKLSERQLGASALKEYRLMLTATDEELNALAKKWYENDYRWKHTPFTIETQRAREYEDFADGPGRPGSWDFLLENISPGEGYDLPAETKKCRECLKACEWVWHAYFPGDCCGSAGWVAICRDCQTWHKEITIYES